jgi:hypothetical protein
MALASFHPSGYVREEAIAHLAAVWDGTELPFLLIRVNDWVAPVRAPGERSSSGSRLIAGLTKWEAIAYLAHALPDHDPVIAAQAEMHVESWFARYNQSFIEPTSGQLTALAAALDAVGEACPPALRQQLRGAHAHGEALIRRR